VAISCPVPTLTTPPMATQRQLATIEKTVEHGRTMSKRKILKGVGYSQAVADHPDRVFKASGVLEFVEKGMECGLTDSLMIEKIRKAMDQRDINKAVAHVWNWLRLRFPESQRPELMIQQNVLQTNIIDMEDVEEGAYWFFEQKLNLSREEIDGLLGI
jgi:hypothetical protein